MIRKLALLAPLLALFACSGDEPACRIQSLEQGSDRYDFAYAPDQVLSGYTITQNSQPLYDVVIDRNEDGTVKQFLINQNGVEKYLQKHTYSNGKLTKVVVLGDDDSDGAIDDIMLMSEFTYENGKLSSQEFDNQGSVTVINYEWTGDNITKEGNEFGYIIYTYDQNPNPRYSENADHAFLTFMNPRNSYSKNNPLTVVSYDAQDQQTDSFEYSYTYNGDGFPMTMSVGQSLQQTYTYSCGE